MKGYNTALLDSTIRQRLLVRPAKGPRKIMRAPLIPSSHIPKPLTTPLCALCPTTLLNIPSKLHFTRSRFISTSAGTITSRPPKSDTPMLQESSMNTIEELKSIIDKTPKIKVDFERIRTILVTDSNDISPNFKRHRTDSLALLLQFKKYSLFEQVFQSISNPSQKDEFLLIQFYLMKNQTIELHDLIQKWNEEELTELMAFTVSFMTDILQRPQKAFTFWILLSVRDASSSSLAQAYEDNTLNLKTSLLSILANLTDIGRLHAVLRGLVQDDNVKKEIILQVSRSFTEIGKFYVQQKIWNLADSSERSPLLLVEIINTLVKYSHYHDAIDLYNANQTYCNEETEAAISPALSIVMAESSAQATAEMIQSGKMPLQQVLFTLKSFLFSERYAEFDQVILALENSNLQKSVDIINLQMTRASLDPNSIMLYLQDIYSIKQKPNSQTFEIIFKQFAKQGDIKSALSLLDLLKQRPETLKSRHFTSLVETCIKAQDSKSIGTILNSMKQVGVRPSTRFVTSLMHLHFKVGQFIKVENVFYQYSSSVRPSVGMYRLLIKSYFARKQEMSAHIVFAAMKEANFDSSLAYLVEIDYYSYQGLFVQALDALTRVKANGIKTIAAHYITLIKNYNRWGRYEDSVIVFNAAVENGHGSDPGLCRELIISLVRLNVVKDGNYQVPIEIVDELIKASNEKKSPLRGVMSFSIIRPLVKYLIRFHRADDAARIMSNYLTVNSEFDTDYRLNYMKEELRLAAANKKWETYIFIYNKFQKRVKSLLNVDGIAPPKLKKIYTSIIKSLYLYHYETKKHVEFAILFHDLLLVHGFTFSSHQLNWIANRLLRRRDTFDYAMKIIERKLIGGYISHRITRIARADSIRLGRRVTPFNERKRYVKPRLAMGFITHNNLLRKVYDQINTRSRYNTKLKEYKQKYPYTIKSVSEIYDRLGRRRAYLRKKAARANN